MAELTTFADPSDRFGITWCPVCDKPVTEVEWISEYGGGRDDGRRTIKFTCHGETETIQFCVADYA